MKKTIFLLGAIATTAIFSCSSQEEPAKPKNYYGIEPEAGTGKTEAYYTLFAVVGLAIFFVVWGLKRLNKKK